MKSQRWSTLVSGLVFALVLTTAGSARAQWGFPARRVSPRLASSAWATGLSQGISPVDYGSCGASELR